MPWIKRSIPRIALQREEAGGEKRRGCGCDPELKLLPVSWQVLVRRADDFTDARELPLIWKLLQPAQVTSEGRPLPYMLFLYGKAMCWWLCLFVHEKSNLKIKEGLFWLKIQRHSPSW